MPEVSTGGHPRLMAPPALSARRPADGVRLPRGGALLDATDDERRPPGLVGGAEATTVVAVEVLVEQHQVAPVRIARVARIVAVARTATVGVGKEDRRQPSGQLVRRRAQVEPPAGARRDLDREPVPVEMVIA